MNSNFWMEKKVFVTGHTGFKGSWLCLTLAAMNARVYGYSLPAPTDPNIFKQANVETVLEKSIEADIRDLATLQKEISHIKPDIIIHMAAQSLVHESYSNPVDTFSTNILGTANVLEAARSIKNKCAIVNVTSDKCYQNKESDVAYIETDPMGGHDPYSASKGCAELVASSYRNSFFKDCNIHLSSARAGNVIGGGDWSKNRLVPDIIRSHNTDNALEIRSPNAIRPWQFVLEPICGYLRLAEKLYNSPTEYDSDWNFGPKDEGIQNVEWIVRNMLDELDSNISVNVHKHILHEATLLKLDCTKTFTKLGWKPRLNVNECVKWTAQWYAASLQGADMQVFTNQQISQYMSLEDNNGI